MNKETKARRRRNRCVSTLLLGSAAAIAAPAGAQEATGDESGAYRLSPILIDAGAQPDDDANSVVARELWVGGKVATSVLDTPASVSVITAEEIEQRNAETVEDVLNYTPGIVTDYYGSDDRNDYFLVRGFQASTYRDGLTLGSMRGVREEPYAYERVEILKGANSTLFGPSDPGGSVNYVTKTPKFEPFGEAYVQAGTFDHHEFGFDVGRTLDEASTLAFRITGKLKDSELEYEGSRDDEAFIMGGLTWEPTPDTSLSLVVDHLERDGTPNSGGYPLDREYDRDLFFGEPDFNDHDVSRTTVTAMARHEFGGGLSARGNLRYSDLADDFGYVYLSDFAGRIGTSVNRFYFGTDSTAQELIGNAMLQYDRSFGEIDSSTLVGAEYRDASTTDSSIFGTTTPIDIANPVYTGAPITFAPYTNIDREFTTQSLFVQQNLSFFDRVIATVGLRNDWMDLSTVERVGGPTAQSGDFSELSLRGALTWKVTDEISTYASYAESVAPPSVGVTPERGQQYEFGVKYQPFGTNALITASVFDLTKKDVTIAVVQPSGVIDRQVIGEQRVRGFEIEGKAELFDGFTLIAGYSFLNAEIVEGTVRSGASFVDVAGNELTSVPAHLANVWANYVIQSQGTRGDISLGLGARYVGSYHFNQQNDNGQSDATILLDAAVGYQVAENVELAVNLSNIMDDQHVVGSGTADFYNPGRAVTATLRYAW